MEALNKFLEAKKAEKKSPKQPVPGQKPALEDAKLGKRAEIEPKSDKIDQKIPEKQSRIDVEALTKRLKEDPQVQASLHRYKEVAEQLIWDFEISAEEVLSFRVRHAQFMDLFQTMQESIKKFDFGSHVDYNDKCADIKTFLVFQVHRIDAMRGVVGAEADLPKTDFKKDLTPFVTMLARCVS